MFLVLLVPTVDGIRQQAACVWDCHSQHWCIDRGRWHSDCQPTAEWYSPPPPLWHVKKTIITDTVAKSWQNNNTRPVREWKFPVRDWEFPLPMTSNCLMPIGWVLRKVRICTIRNPQMHAYAIYKTICMLYKVTFTFSCNYECIFVLLKWKDLQYLCFSEHNTVVSHFHIVYILSPRQAVSNQQVPASGLCLSRRNSVSLLSDY